MLKQKYWTKNERLWTLVVNKINSNFFNLSRDTSRIRHSTRTTRRRNIARVRSHYIPPKPAAPSRLFRILLFCFIVSYTKVTIINYYYYNIISTRYVFNQETRDSGFIFLGNSTITYFNLISCTIVWTFLNFQCLLVEINDYILYSATRTIYINSCCKFHFQT